MDIFNRKKLAAAEEENRMLKEACAKFQTDTIAAENRAERYKRERDEVRNNIGKQVAQNGELTKSLSELRYLKEKDRQVFIKKFEELKQKLGEADATISDLKLCLEQSEDIASIEDTKKVPYKIRGEVASGKLGDNNNKEKNYEKYMASIYKSNKSFFTSNELKFYDLLSPLAQSHGLIIFSKVRLAEIIDLWERFYDEKSLEDAKKQNPFEKGVAFEKAKDWVKYPNKKAIYNRIQELNPNFNNSDYKIAFLYPLFRLHIDFLLCKKVENYIVPLMAIELNGKEHYKNDDWIKKTNDQFKRSVFFSDYVYIGLLSIYNDVLTEKRDELMKIMSDTLSRVSDGYNKVNWNDTQNSLSELAKPYIEKIGK